MKIKLLVMDVDGTLTDGKINMGPNGELFKAFDIKDGYAINEMLPAHGIVPAIITGRISSIVENRARELHIDELYQGKHDKLDTLRELMQKYACSRENVAYIGDDILDIVFATREPDKTKGLESLKEQIQVGASPRATLCLNKAARANALVHGRAYATPQDVKEIVHDVLRHRILLTYEAEAENINSDNVIDKILSVIPVP